MSKSTDEEKGVDKNVDQLLELVLMCTMCSIIKF